MKASKIKLLPALAQLFFGLHAGASEPNALEGTGSEVVRFCDSDRGSSPVWKTKGKAWSKLTIEIGENGLVWEDEGSSAESVEIVVKSCGLALRIQQRLGLVEAKTQVARISLKNTRVTDAFSLTHDKGVNVQIQLQTDHTSLEAPQLRIDKIQLSQECIEWRDNASLISGNSEAVLNCESRSRFKATQWLGKPRWRVAGNFVHMETEKNQFSAGRDVFLDSTVLHADIKSLEDVWEGTEFIQADGATAVSLSYERGRILSGGIELVGPAHEVSEQGMYYHPKSKWISQILGDLRLGKTVATKMQDHQLPQGVSLKSMFWLHPKDVSSVFVIRHWRSAVKLDRVGLGTATVDWEGLPHGIQGNQVEWAGRPEQWKVPNTEWRCDQCPGIPESQTRLVPHS